MSTEMDTVKTYCDTLAADLRSRVESVERLNANMRTDLSVSMSLQAVRNLASLLQELSGIAVRVEHLANAEQRRAEAAEAVNVTALALIAHLRGKE